VTIPELSRLARLGSSVVTEKDAFIVICRDGQHFASGQTSPKVQHGSFLSASAQTSTAQPTPALQWRVQSTHVRARPRRPLGCQGNPFNKMRVDHGPLLVRAPEDRESKDSNERGRQRHRGVRVLWSGSEGRGLLVGLGRAALSTAQTTLPPSAVGSAPKARQRAATTLSPRPCASNLE
jgi:hypothetical protein